MSENKYNFEKLTPIDNADIGIYNDALDFVFENNDLKNIALSGAYSAGKSSVLESYKAKPQNADKQFLHISLARFEATDEIETEKANNQQSVSQKFEVKESVLEWKILNQLIHQIDVRRIPQTNFRIKYEVSKAKLALTAVLSLVFILSLLHILSFANWAEFVDGLSLPWLKWFLMPSARVDLQFFSGLICIAIVGVFAYQLIKLQVNKTVFKKLSADKVEIEMFTNSDDSYFDKYLNEVLYLFNQSKADVIVFEDMDRYNAHSIFERLREVNTLINVKRRKQSRTIIDGILRWQKTYKPLRFFYLLRDDIFVSKDRTKFFDYIVPIVPVIDSSNSYDKFIEVLKKGKIFDEFDEHFLRTLSLYVDDMRILLNIYNEFMVYNTRIATTEQSKNKMLAMITYKNLFPRDFAELQLGKGYVASLFDRKIDFVEKYLNILEKSIDEKRGIIANIKAENFESLAEAHQYFAVKDLIAQRYSVSGVDFTNHRYYNASIRKELDKRLLLIGAKNNDKTSMLEAEISNLQTQIDNLYSSNLAEISDVGCGVEIFNSEEAKNYFDSKSMHYYDLLVFLLRNGHIDETYHDFMTYFYPNSLTEQDKKYLRGIFDRHPKKFNYPIDNPKLVLTYLSKKDMKQSSILNFSLMKYLLESDSDAEYLDLYFDYIVSEKNYQYIEEAILWGIRDKRFISKVNGVWPEFISDIIANSDGKISSKDNAGIRCLNEVFSRENQAVAMDDFILMTLHHASSKDLLAVNHDNCITSYIQNTHEFLEFGQRYKGIRRDEPNRDILVSRFIQLCVKFNSLDYEKADKGLFEDVYKNCLYDINYPNIALMLRVIYELEETSDFKHKSYTLIMSDEKSPLAQYVNENINDYLVVVQAHCAGKINDDERTALVLLNNDDVSNENKNWYISDLETKITNLTDIVDKNLWKVVVESDIVVHSEVNVMEYFIRCENTLTEELVLFINSNDYEYDYTTVRCQYSNDIQMAFFNAILVTNKITNTHYKQIIGTLGWHYEKGFSKEGISYDKLAMLIDHRIIWMSEGNLPFMRKSYPNAMLHYIKKNINEYVELVGQVEFFAEDEAIQVISLDINDKYKIKLIGQIGAAITAQNGKYSDAVRAHILTHNLESGDIPHYTIAYPNEGVLTKRAILSMVEDNLDGIFESDCTIAVELFDDARANTKRSNEVILPLFACLVKSLDEATCRQYLRQVGFNEFDGLFERKRPKIVKDAFSERILLAFKDKHWINIFEIDKDDGNYYRAYGRKFRSEESDEETDKMIHD